MEYYTVAVNKIDHLTLEAPSLIDGLQWLGSLGITVSFERVSSSQYTIILLKGSRSFGGWLEVRVTVEIFGVVIGPFLRRTQPLFHSRGSGTVNWLKSGNW